MPLNYRQWSLRALAALGLWLSTRPASACEPPPCTPSMFLPVTGSVPSNAVEFLWRPAWNREAVPHLYKLENGQRSELQLETLAGPDGPEGLKRLRPTQSVAAGTTLLLESAEPTCEIAASVPAMVTVSEAADIPGSLGTLKIAETDASTTLHIPTSHGQCSDDFEVASARLTLTLDAGAQPFATALRHALLVDGQKRQQPPLTPAQGQYPDFGLERRLEDVLYSLCTQPSDAWTNDIPAGSHRVQWVATLPNGSELRSNEVDIELRCSDAATDLGSCSLRPTGEGVAPESWLAALALALLLVRVRLRARQVARATSDRSGSSGCCAGPAPRA